MNDETKNYIQYENIAALFVPGLLQLENKQKLKGILFILLVIGFIIAAFYTRSMSYSILLTYIYAFGVLDSLSITAANKDKRISISDAAFKLLDKPDKSTQGQFRSNSFEKGQKFEDFVLKKFNKGDFSLVKKTLPIPKFDGPIIENNLDPDFVFRFKKNLEKFAVEAKYRSYLGNYALIYPDQMARYKQFEEEEKIPVYIVIGLGGFPDNPNEMFLVPLKKAASHELSIEFLSKYRVDPNRDFTWRPGSVWNSGYLYQRSEKPPNPL